MLPVTRSTATLVDPTHPRYTPPMSLPDLLNARDYQTRMAGLEAIKEADWLARQRSRSPSERLEAAAELRTWAHQARPDTDWEAHRREDLENHVRVAALMRRADGKISD